MDLFDLLLYKSVAGDSGGGGGGEISTQSINISANGTYRAPTGKAYTPVNVNVPNSYGASDEGKVVDDGALVSQTTETISQNGTVDTTTVREVTVNVPDVPQIDPVVRMKEFQCFQESRVAVSICETVIQNIENPINGWCILGNPDDVHI